MPSSDRHVLDLLRQITSQDHAVIHIHLGKLPVYAALTYVGECLGFRYARTYRVGKHKELYVQLVRDPSAEAQARAAATVAAYPAAGVGGPVPGMQSGTLDPLPEVRAEVDVIGGLIQYDSFTAVQSTAMLKVMTWGIGPFLLVMALLTGKYALLLPLAVVFPLGMYLAVRLGKSRQAKVGARLAAAGCVLLQDRAGRGRYVRPSELPAWATAAPGHAATTPPAPGHAAWTTPAAPVHGAQHHPQDFARQNPGAQPPRT